MNLMVVIVIRIQKFKYFQPFFYVVEIPLWWLSPLTEMESNLSNKVYHLSNTLLWKCLSALTILKKEDARLRKPSRHFPKSVSPCASFNNSTKISPGMTLVVVASPRMILPTIFFVFNRCWNYMPTYCWLQLWNQYGN